MGFRSKLLGLIGFIIFGFELSAQQSKLDSVNLDYIYNKWVLSEGESSFGNLILRNEDFFKGNTSDGKARNRWRFAEHSDVFVNWPYSKVGVYKRQIPRRRPKRTCGSHGPGGRSIGRFYYSPPTRIKGKWSLVDDGYTSKIKLFYYQAEKGKPFKLSSTKVYEIIHLERDLMILRKE